MAELHWYEAHGIGKKELKAKRYLDQVPQGPGTEICRLRPQRRLMQRPSSRTRSTLPFLTKKPKQHGQLRVIDESWEDYLFSADRFVAIDVPAAVRASLLKAS